MEEESAGRMEGEAGRMTKGERERRNVEGGEREEKGETKRCEERRGNDKEE